jgi:CelD/BcsL family acetyltransferase involved in cellulose biosynthesis
VTSPASGVREIDATMEELLALREERVVFLSPVWLRTWLAEFGERYEPVFVECGDSKPLAVAPLMRDDSRLTFAGDPEICDFMDVLVAPDEAEQAYEAFWREICAEPWTELVLWGLMASSPAREAVLRLATESGYSAVEEKEAVAPRLELPGSFEEYVASLGKKDRHELRRKMRRLFDSGASVDLQVFSEQSDVVAAMDDFLDLHTRSRQDKTEFMTPEMASFFRRMASAMSAAGYVRLFMLSINAKPAAAVFCFDAGSYLYMYNSGYDPNYANLSVGLVSKALCLQWAIENGKKGLDFLRGNEPYKYDFGAKDQQIYRIVVRREA